MKNPISYIWNLLKLPSNRSDQLGGESVAMDSLNSYIILLKEERKRHPIRWFLTEGMPNGIVRAWKDSTYWLRCHTWNRYHLLDLRDGQSIPKEHRYHWGYRDVPEQMMAAMMNLLAIYVDEEEPYLPSLEEIDSASTEWEKEILFLQRGKILEAKAILNWWRVERFEEEKLTYSNETKEEEMLIRLVRIRPSLWT
jgi:hypothetical protein